MTPLDSIRVGPLWLPNRLVMAPLGRARAEPESREPTASVARYYAQRATAGLIVSEATHVSANSVSRPGTSAIHSEGQVYAWRRVNYLHLIEPVTTPADRRLAADLRLRWRGPLILCGGFDRASAYETLGDGRADLIAFGAGFIANPDLVERLRRDAAWNTPDPDTFYVGGDRGTIDYPFLDAPGHASSPASAVLSA